MGVKSCSSDGTGPRYVPFTSDSGGNLLRFNALWQVLHKLKAKGLPFLSDEMPRGSTRVSFNGPSVYGRGMLPAFVGIFNSSMSSSDKGSSRLLAQYVSDEHTAQVNVESAVDDVR